MRSYESNDSNQRPIATVITIKALLGSLLYFAKSVFLFKIVFMIYKLKYEYECQ